ncbi:MAG: LysE family translocator [Flavobacteriales bacterium Tduv]
MLSLFLIGPVFFMLIETSLFKGPKAAIMLDLGVLLADVVCIALAYYSSWEISEYIQNHPSLFKLGGFIIFIYGWFMTFSKGSLHFKNELPPANNYLHLILKGFLLNFINIGVVVFWISIVLVISATYPEPGKFILYIGIVLTTSFYIDLIKILLAGKFHHKFNDQLAYKIRKIMGLILAVFGVILFIKSFFLTSELKKDIPIKFFEKSTD